MAEPHDVRGHFPYHEYPHPDDHSHAVAEPLTPENPYEFGSSQSPRIAWQEGFDEGIDVARAAAPLDALLDKINALDSFRSYGRTGGSWINKADVLAALATPAPEPPRCEHGAIREPCIPCSEAAPEPTGLDAERVKSCMGCGQPVESFVIGDMRNDDIGLCERCVSAIRALPPTQPTTTTPYAARLAGTSE